MLNANLTKIKERILNACQRAGQSSDQVQICAASKFQPVEKIRELAALGVRIFGENYVQEARGKQQRLADLHVAWHLIGALQTNKVKKVVGRFDCVQAVDREPVARALSQTAQAAGLRQKVLIEVNGAGEVSKGGVAVEEFARLYEICQSLPALEVQGLMTMPPLGLNENQSRHEFAKIYKLGSQLNLQTFSMGTSGDFEYAILEGSTMVRLGTVLFGERKP